MTASDGLHPTHLYDYLLAARQRLLDFVRPVTFAQYVQEFPFAHKTLRHTLVHIAAAEWMYERRLRGEPIPPLPERRFTPFYDAEFPPFEAAWGAQSEQTKRTLSSITDWSHPIEYVVAPPPGASTPPPKATRIRTTAAGFATQLFVHEVHHRAQAMAMLRHLGVAAEVLDYSALMFDRAEVAE